jgi:hypothetical protein
MFFCLERRARRGNVLGLRLVPSPVVDVSSAAFPEIEFISPLLFLRLELIAADDP